LRLLNESTKHLEYYFNALQTERSASWKFAVTKTIDRFHTLYEVQCCGAIQRAVVSEQIAQSGS
jgi:hypothetical protein